MKKLIVLLSFFAFAFVATPISFASGDSNCQTIYGGGQVCRDEVKFSINKLVQSPSKGGNYVENLTANDAKYAPGQNINFKIVIKNTGNKEIQNLNVVDTFPQFLTFVAGAGVSKVGASQINFVVGKIAAGQTLEYVLTTKAADAGSLNQAITCVVNNVKATSKDGTLAEDNSQVCIEKNIVVPTQAVMPKPFIKDIPSTGPEMALLFGLIPAGALGAFLKKKAN